MAKCHSSWLLIKISMKLSMMSDRVAENASLDQGPYFVLFLRTLRDFLRKFLFYISEYCEFMLFLLGAIGALQ